MKKILFSLIAVISMFTSVNAQAIVAGSGICKTSGNPNSNATLDSQPVSECVVVNDVTTNTLWFYNASLVSGARWTQIKTNGDGAIASASVVSGNLRLVRTNADGTTTNIDVPVASIAPIQSVTASGTVVATVTGSSIAITSTDPDESITNEGTIGVGVGTATTAVITSNTSGSTGVTISQGTGIGITETVSANGGTITVTNSAPDQTVALTGAGTVTTSGTYPNFTVTGASGTLAAGGTTSPTIALSGNGSGTVTFVGAGGLSLSQSGGTITLTPAAAPTYAYYTDDAAAATGGVSAEAFYKLDTANPYGLPRGTIRARQ